MRGVTRLLALGSLVLTVPIVAIRPAPDGFVGVLSTRQIALAAVLGLALGIVASLLVIVAAFRAARLARTGTPWRRIADTIADGSVLGAVLAFTAAALPPLMLILAVRLIWAGWLPRELLAVAVLLPTVLLPALAWRLRRWARARHREAPRAPSEAAGARPPRAPWVAVALGIVLALALVAAAATVALVPLMAYGFESLSLPLSLAGNVAVRMRVVEAARRYRLPPDPTIDLETAGRAYARVVSAANLEADSTFPALQRPIPNAIRRRWEPERPPWAGNPISLIPRARAGLSAQERAAIEDALAHPGFAAWAVVARAPARDSFGAHARLPLPRTLTPWELPMPFYAGLQGAGRVRVAGAALQLSGGRADQAETTLREVVSFGVTLADDAPNLIEGMVGTAIAGHGLTALQALYEATGRTGEANALAAAFAAAQAWQPDIDATALPAEAWRATTLAGLAGLNVPRSIRWGYLEAAALLPCTNVAELLLGPRADIGRALVRARQVLVRHPGERALFEVVEQTIPRVAAAIRREQSATAILATVLGKVFGDEMLVGCSLGLGALRY